MDCRLLQGNSWAEVMPEEPGLVSYIPGTFLWLAKEGQINRRCYKENVCVCALLHLFP